MISRTLVAMMFFLSGVSLAQAQHHFHVTGNSTCSTAHGLHCGTCNDWLSGNLIRRLHSGKKDVLRAQHARRIVLVSGEIRNVITEDRLATFLPDWPVSRFTP